MKKKHVTAFLLTLAALAAAGCMVTDKARHHEPGGGTGITFIDRQLDAMTVLEGGFGAALHGGLKSADEAVGNARHFAANLVTSGTGPNLSKLQKARRQDAKRRTSRLEITDKVAKANVTVGSPILDDELLGTLGLYIVWDTALADTDVRNAWVDDGVILLETRDVQTMDYYLFAFDLHSGFAKWTFRFLSPLDSRPTLDDDIVWTSSSSTIYPLDADLGEPLWKTRVKFTVSSPMFIIGKRQHIGTLEHAVYVLTGKDKYPDWSFGTFAPITAMPIVDRKVLYVGSEDGSFYAYNHVSRQNLWQIRTGHPITADPTHDADNVYFGSEDYNVYCVSKADGKIMWKFRAQGPIRRPVRVLNENTLLVKAEGRGLYALDKATGDPKWCDDEGVHPVALGRNLYVLTEDNAIKALDPQTGKALWKHSVRPFAFVPPNVATDAITLCTADAQMLLIQEKNGMDLKRKKSIVQAEDEADEE
ncbi:MAG: PQQ-binding-like beta-propeller repeat protein [Planctomycetes bacterium]|nr:PQQ-binding-like beta-propeller repeat protein [Planctomycetota bacterium]